MRLYSPIYQATGLLLGKNHNIRWANGRDQQAGTEFFQVTEYLKTSIRSTLDLLAQDLPHDPEQKQSAYDRGDDIPDDAHGTESEDAEHESSHPRAQDTDDQVLEKAKSLPFPDLTREPARECTDNDDQNEVEHLKPSERLIEQDGLCLRGP